MYRTFTETVGKECISDKIRKIILGIWEMGGGVEDGKRKEKASPTYRERRLLCIEKEK